MYFVAVSMNSTQQMSVDFPLQRCGNQKCLQTLPDIFQRQAGVGDTNSS